MAILLPPQSNLIATNIDITDFRGPTFQGKIAE
jgi:hypothetical protein